MTEPAIQVQDLGKKYRLGGTAGYHRASELLMDVAALPWRMASSLLRSSARPDAAPPPDAPNPPNTPAPGDAPDTLWALRHVSFEVQPGEVLGIIGRNGSGKSTLLKLLSRITEPTEGRAIVRGRVGSLLEVGTGFHPELTGKENIFLNGAILGMSPAEVRRKFDEIVAFSELEKFLDTPVKHYSSGMYMRLAFAVAAHLEPEILIVDEVLAVGDAEFQKKCLGKMNEVSRGGRTVLFVSHNMAAVRSLCGNAILLCQGQIAAVGLCSSVLTSYLLDPLGQTGDGAADLRAWSNRHGSGEARIVGASLHRSDGRPATRVSTGERLTVALDIEATQATVGEISAVCLTMDGIGAIHITQHDARERPRTLAGRTTVRFSIDCLPLLPGAYCWNLAIHGPAQCRAIDVVLDVLPFTVDESPISPRPFVSSNRVAMCNAPTTWQWELPS